MTAATVVLGLALGVAVTAVTRSSLSARMRWLLLLLSLAVGMLALLRLRGTL
jgi:hypothetical protein